MGNGASCTSLPKPPPHEPDTGTQDAPTHPPPPPPTGGLLSPSRVRERWRQRKQRLWGDLADDPVPTTIQPDSKHNHGRKDLTIVTSEKGSVPSSSSRARVAPLPITNSSSSAQQSAGPLSPSSAPSPPLLSPTSAAVAATSFPRTGIRLNHFREFIEENGGVDAFQGLTTSDVCHRIVKPLTQNKQCSYCDYITDKQHQALSQHNWWAHTPGKGEPIVGVAQVFVSHAWAYTFLDIVEALEYHFRNKSGNKKANNQAIFLWFDVFSVNQHYSIDVDFHWWTTTFQKAIQEFGHTVMVFAPWHNPIPLTRAWCLWELYCTVSTETKFEVALNRKEQEDFFDNVVKDTDGSIAKMLATIDVEKSSCYNPEDKDRIFRAVRANVGFNKLNSVVLDRMRKWVLHVTEQAVEDKVLLLTQQGVGEREDTPARRQVVNLKFSLANMYESQGVYDQAEALYTECLAYRREILGLDHSQTLQAMNNLAVLYQAQGSYAKAEELYRISFDRQRTSLGLRHANTLATMSNLAMLYYSQGMLTQAEPLLAECLAMRRQVLGRTNAQTLTSMNNLAMVYQEQKNLVKAEPLFLDCLAQRKESLGINHPDTLQSLHNLGSLYKEKGSAVEREKAEKLLTECLDHRKIVLGVSHPNTLMTMETLAMLLQSQGNTAGTTTTGGTSTSSSSNAVNKPTLSPLQRAEVLFKDCLHHRSIVLGTDHPHTLRAMNNLAVVYQTQGDHDQALPLLRECYEQRKRVLGPTNAQTVSALTNLAMLYKVKGDYAQAEPLLFQCYVQRKMLSGPTHAETMQLLSVLALVYYQQGELPRAEAMFAESLALKREQFGPSHAQTLQAMSDLAILYEEQKKFTDAVPLHEEILQQKKLSFGVNHRETLSAMYTLGIVLRSAGKQWVRAEEVLTECLAQQKTLLGIQHADTIRTDRLLQVVKVEREKEAKAIAAQGGKKKVVVAKNVSSNVPPTTTTSTTVDTTSLSPTTVTVTTVVEGQSVDAVTLVEAFSPRPAEKKSHVEGEMVMENVENAL